MIALTLDLWSIHGGLFNYLLQTREKFFHHVSYCRVFDDEGDGVFLGIGEDTNFVVVDREFGVECILSWEEFCFA